MPSPDEITTTVFHGLPRSLTISHVSLTWSLFSSRSFTARFYFSIAHNCIPVRYDGWHRGLQPAPMPRHKHAPSAVPTASATAVPTVELEGNGTTATPSSARATASTLRQLSTQTAYPFVHRIEWGMVVYHAPDDSNGTLLDALLSMPQEEVRASASLSSGCMPMPCASACCSSFDSQCCYPVSLLRACCSCSPTRSTRGWPTSATWHRC